MVIKRPNDPECATAILGVESTAFHSYQAETKSKGSIADTYDPQTNGTCLLIRRPLQDDRGMWTYNCSYTANIPEDDLVIRDDEGQSIDTIARAQYDIRLDFTLTSDCGDYTRFTIGGNQFWDMKKHDTSFRDWVTSQTIFINTQADLRARDSNIELMGDVLRPSDLSGMARVSGVLSTEDARITEVFTCRPATLKAHTTILISNNETDR
uniref:Uncharacterized protein n=1 Tax=Kwoniella dejecticola CBS 10117 TaxID=1296121 RepID=A0A1A6A2D1_9TREE|nr:uncharacterized protein I303_05077 [Kwoniella dejecticola CBS 10117]OBR84220.1 hypothetical protein I303_05077 [Kwoniella dejecticola CBS 10117]